MKGSGSSQPGNCSALLPPLAPFPQPFLAARQPLAQSLCTVPSSSWSKVRGKGLASPRGFIPSPSAHPVPQSRTPSLWPEPLQIARIPSRLPCCAPMARRTMLHAELPQTPALVAGDPGLGSERGCSPAWVPIPHSLPITVSLHACAEPLRPTGGWGTRQLRHHPRPGTGLLPHAPG